MILFFLKDFKNLTFRIKKNQPVFFLSKEKFQYKPKLRYSRKFSFQLNLGGGFLGVGASEILVIGIVAWLVLGPKRVYQLVKDIGKLSFEIKNITEQAKETFKETVSLNSNQSDILFEDQKKKIRITSLILSQIKKHQDLMI